MQVGLGGRRDMNVQAPRDRDTRAKSGSRRLLRACRSSASPLPWRRPDLPLLSCSMLSVQSLSPPHGVRTSAYGNGCLFSHQPLLSAGLSCCFVFGYARTLAAAHRMHIRKTPYGSRTFLAQKSRWRGHCARIIHVSSAGRAQCLMGRVGTGSRGHPDDVSVRTAPALGATRMMSASARHQL
ncbi:hypothetical protein TREES_T100014972 [Tupaia chinensis]|uniref:Uncharacterized protein n=1 Tax=Tupaia chinensis TaxID=246437 RepID=L9KTR2_TUPCH|nr:hypothetical protein TREES_T100014972 [Tupaia chinensis]